MKSTCHTDRPKAYFGLQLGLADLTLSLILAYRQLSQQ